MAQIERREGKKGVSYLITVYGGKNAEGKQVRHRKTFAPPQTWSEARQEKAAWNEASNANQELKYREKGRKTAQKSRECKYVANKSHNTLLRCLRQ